VINRRGFLVDALAVAGAGKQAFAGWSAVKSAAAGPEIEAANRALQKMNSATTVLRTRYPLDEDKIKPRGTFFQAAVPDTLDLAERARLCINVLTQNMNPAQHYGVYQAFKFGHSPFQLAGLTWNLPAKNARALPLLRTMCGSSFNLDVECSLMTELLSNVSPEGLIYCPIDNDGAPKGTYYPAVGGILCQALANWHARDQDDPLWRKRLALVAAGLDRLAIRVPQSVCAYYPLESSIDPQGTWHFTARGKPTISYTPPEEPASDQQGLEGTVKWDQGLPLVGLVLDYKLNGRSESLAAAAQVARFILKPGLWVDTTSVGYPGNEHGIFAGHFHGITTGLCGLLAYARVADDDRLKQIVREFPNVH